MCGNHLQKLQYKVISSVKWASSMLLKQMREGISPVCSIQFHMKKVCWVKGRNLGFESQVLGAVLGSAIDSLAIDRKALNFLTFKL